jgi:predicted SAM-dependent methyltransferase
MKIISKQVEEDIENHRALRLELGSGGFIREGFFGVDAHDLPGVAIQADLNLPLNLLPDDSVDEIVSYHCFEHVQNFLGLMSELHRVMKPGATMKIVVPHFSNPYYYSDPTHLRFFGLYSMYYFVEEANQPGDRKVPSFYTDFKFLVIRTEINLMPRSIYSRLRWPFLGTLLNRNFSMSDWYERRLCWIVPASTIEYVLTPVK